MREGKLLLLDEAREFVDLLTVSLSKAGYTVVSAHDPATAMDLLRTERPDVVVIDNNLGRWNGLDVMKEIRPRTRATIIMLTAGSGAHERTVCKALGADDCLAKPFGQRDLIAMVQAHLDQAAEREESSRRVVRAGDFVLDMARRSLSWRDTKVDLSLAESRLLEQLLSHSGAVVTVPALSRRVWPEAGGGTSALVHAAVTRLRHKLEKTPGEPRFLRDAPGGYIFNPVASDLGFSLV